MSDAQSNITKYAEEKNTTHNEKINWNWSGSETDVIRSEYRC